MVITLALLQHFVKIVCQPGCWYSAYVNKNILYRPQDNAVCTSDEIGGPGNGPPRSKKNELGKK